MYLPYLMLGYAVAAVLMLGACYISSRAVPGLAGVRLLSWALVSGLAGLLFTATRAFAPLWITILLANEAVFGFSALYYAALARGLGVRTPVGAWGGGLLVAGLAGNGWFTYVRPDLTARILISTAIPAIFALGGAVLLLSATGAESALARAPMRRVATGALGWLEVLIVIADLTRCVLTLLYPPRQMLHVDVIQAGYTYFNLVLNISSAAGLLWLTSWMQRDDLYTRANTDGLTGLLNRRAFEDVLTRELRRAHADARSLPLILADIDDFKGVNDTWGHQAGDEVLCEVGNALRRILRPSDAISRFGGEEFAILLRDSDLPRAAEIAERLRCEVESIPGLPGGVRTSVSLGVACSHPGESSDQLLARCDQALYRSKRDGRNRVSIAANRTEVEAGASQRAAQLVHADETERSA
ncbi:MAG TPA: GGDEF domain-containing protein [Terracidiphilus sp.]